MNYMIYAQAKGMKQYRPVGRNGLVFNLIYALMYETLEAVTHDMNELQKLNPDIKFEVRKRVSK